MVVAAPARTGRDAGLRRAGDGKPAAEEPDRVGAFFQRDPGRGEPEAGGAVCGQVYGSEGAGEGGDVCEVWDDC